MDAKALLFQFIGFIAPILIPALATEGFEALQNLWTWLDKQGALVKRVGAGVAAFALVTAFNAVGAQLPPEVASNITALTADHIAQFGMAGLAFLFKTQNEMKATKHGG